MRLGSGGWGLVYIWGAVKGEWLVMELSDLPGLRNNWAPRRSGRKTFGGLKVLKIDLSWFLFECGMSGKGVIVDMVLRQFYP